MLPGKVLFGKAGKHDGRQDEISDLEGVVEGGLEFGDSTLGAHVVIGCEARSHLDEEASETPSCGLRTGLGTG